ncbi:amidase [Sulfitobacter sp. G21635-S1]|uniref:amidase n=1 Tax=Sulfitobacter sp. G21635-S1 TaxID=3014043 RepID=UPI0022AED93C|nr:amidase [Sulfitobacter sp. G21635-S1]MCZ4254300.1 amidase [Sulfitobacter sp. G21635-S1]
MSFADHSIADLGRLLRRQALSATELTRWTLEQAEATNGTLHAFISLLPERAMAEAAAADRAFASGIDLGPMQGIPYAAKDLFDAKGVATTCQSKFGLEAVADADAGVIERLTTGGAVLIGKTSTFEYALYGPDPDLAFPLARNPWNLEHYTGGSSSGSAVAIAAGLVRMGLGTDTGGSIRTPSSWCGTVGLKPTFGRVTRRGCFPLSASLDHCGPLARSVSDAAIALQVLAGHDAGDPDCHDGPVPNYLEGLERSVAGTRVGIAVPLLETASAETLAAVERTADLLRSEGAEVFEVSTPDLLSFGSVVRALLIIEGYHVHQQRMRDRIEDFGPLSARRLALAPAYSAPDYLAALKARRLLAEAVSGVLRTCDVILCATTPGSAPSLTQEATPFDPATPSMTNPQNVMGNPAISVPVGLDSNGLPLAVQLVGRLFEEATLLQVAHTVERLTGWQKIGLPNVQYQPGQGVPA